LAHAKTAIGEIDEVKQVEERVERTRGRAESGRRQSLIVATS
jgi:hypothetical protein